MEFAIPGVLLIGMYVISNNDNDKETFRNKNALPNTQLPPNNFPKEDYNDITNNKNKYVGRQRTYKYNNDFKNPVDKYYLPENYKEIAKEQEKIHFETLAGNVINANDLEHNNQVPFFGSQVTQVIGNGYESVLDFHTGSGSNHIEKRGMAPLFTPEKNMAYTHGTPSSTDYMQNRMKGVLTNKLNNTKPWEEIRVGPGLNKGYGIKGSGGFNSGLEARDTYLPKTIDELRVKTNPKNTYGGVFLGPKGILKRGIEGKVEKNRPDRHYENTADRWLTTTGLEKAQTSHATEILKPENRANLNKEYFGHGNDIKNGIYQQGNYKPSDKQELCSYNLGAAKRRDGGNIVADDYGKGGMEILPNSRNINNYSSPFGNVGGVISAITAPILDIIRSTKKENIIGNKRPTGNARGAQQTPYHNPNDTLKTTIKEQTEQTKHIIQGVYDIGGGYATKQFQPVSVQRDSTNICNYMGNSAAPADIAKPQTYVQYQNANFNPNKEQISKVNRYNIGNMELYNNYQNVTNMANRGTNPVRGAANMPKNIANMSTQGLISGKNTRETYINRNTNDMVSALNNNPYAQSLYSVA